MLFFCLVTDFSVFSSSYFFSFLFFSFLFLRVWIKRGLGGCGVGSGKRWTKIINRNKRAVCSAGSPSRTELQLSSMYRHVMSLRVYIMLVNVIHVLCIRMQINEFGSLSGEWPAIKIYTCM